MRVERTNVRAPIHRARIVDELSRLERRVGSGERASISIGALTPGGLIGVGASGYTIADNSVPTIAWAVVLSESGSLYQLGTTGEVVTVSGGHGMAAAPATVYLGTAGAPTTTRPVGATVKALQVVGVVVDSEKWIFQPHGPEF